MLQPRIVIVEDTKADGERLVNLLLETHFHDRQNQVFKLQASDVELWWVATSAELMACVKKARTTPAQIMIADLHLLEEEEAITSALRAGQTEAENAAPEEEWNIDFWRSVETLHVTKKKLLPGGLIAETFCRAKPGQRFICHMSAHAKGWYKAMACAFPSRASLFTDSCNDPDTKATIAAWIEKLWCKWDEVLWEPRTTSWFERLNDAVDMPHDWTPESWRVEDKTRRKRTVREWLGRVIPIDLPTAWFDREDQFRCLWKSLAGLTGYHSCANGVVVGEELPDYNLSFQNLVLLLAIAMGEETSVYGAGVGTELLSEVKWNDHFGVALPRQDMATAQNAIRFLVDGFFGELLVREEGGSRVRNVEKVFLEKGLLKVTLGFNSLSAAAGRIRFIDRAVSPEDGRFLPWQGLLVKGTNARGETTGRDPRMIVAVKEQGGKTMMSFRSVAGT